MLRAGESGRVVPEGSHGEASSDTTRPPTGVSHVGESGPSSATGPGVCTERSGESLFPRYRQPSFPPLSSSLFVSLFSFSTLSPFLFSTLLPPSSLSLTLSFLYLSLPPYILGTVDLSFLSPFACILLQLFVFPTDGVLFSPQAGKVAGNPTAGRKLMEAVSCIPQMEETKFESILNSTMQVYKLESNSSLLLGEYHQSNIRDATHTKCCMRYRLATCIRTLRKSCDFCCV